jgi:hypothetical protein
VVVSLSGSRLSCWCVSLCQADLRKPSFLCSEDLFDEAGDDGDEEEPDNDDGLSFFLEIIVRRSGCKTKARLDPHF